MRGLYVCVGKVMAGSSADWCRDTVPVYSVMMMMIGGHIRVMHLLALHSP